MSALPLEGPWATLEAWALAARFALESQPEGWFCLHDSPSECPGARGGDCDARVAVVFAIVALLGLAIAGMVLSEPGSEQPAPVLAPAFLVLTEDEHEEVRDAVGAEAGRRSDGRPAVGAEEGERAFRSSDGSLLSSVPHLLSSLAEVETSGPSTEPTPLPGLGVSSSSGEGSREALAATAAPRRVVLSLAEVLAVLARTSWPGEWHARVASMAVCESGLEATQTRGDGGLAWGLLSVRVDAHPHLAASFDLLDAWGNLEAGWRVFEEREALGWSGWDAWRVCSRRAA